MSTTARFLRLLGSAILVCGLLSAAGGVVLAETDDCEPLSGVDVVRLGPDEDGRTTEMHQYDELSERERRTFDEALADLRASGDGSGSIYGADVYTGDLGGTVVHEGVRYEVVRVAGDCPDVGVLPMLGGAVGSVLGLLVLAVSLLWNRWDRR
ncbi:hypothetical protein [Halomarina oriensis]|uniref:DUF7979 domain-containing protein n=1 Tax=Halomarina oriensis TaxID=671145 RepID=A0A6B0GMZ1_9EURY|nr:hypothetical protein [Halomarina oriensis]MWG34073.1 hypothetical protein [Halomarina oriensis]